MVVYVWLTGDYHSSSSRFPPKRPSDVDYAPDRKRHAGLYPLRSVIVTMSWFNYFCIKYDSVTLCHAGLYPLRSVIVTVSWFNYFCIKYDSVTLCHAGLYPLRSVIVTVSWFNYFCIKYDSVTLCHAGLYPLRSVIVTVSWFNYFCIEYDSVSCNTAFVIEFTLSETSARLIAFSDLTVHACFGSWWLL